MGRTVHGWVEYCHVADEEFAGDDWYALINLREMLGGDPPLAGCLFGTESNPLFEPLAPERGLPPEVSRMTRLDYEEASGDHASWVSLAELEATDWDATPDLSTITTQEEWDRAVHRTERRNQRGRLEAKFVDAWTDLPEDTLSTLKTDHRARHDGDVYQVVPKRLRDMAVYDWAMLWTWLTALRDRWGLDGDNIRLVVWTTD